MAPQKKPQSVALIVAQLKHHKNSFGYDVAPQNNHKN
jgi:hypothetical protein